MSGPKIFQRFILNILSDMDNMFVYIDNIIIFNKSSEEHNETLFKVLKRLYDNQLKINFEKAKFFSMR